MICLHTSSAGAETPRVVRAAHQAGLEVMIWTPGPAEAAELARDGVDAVCVDDIPGVQAALAGLGPAAAPARPADTRPALIPAGGAGQCPSAEVRCARLSSQSGHDRTEPTCSSRAGAHGSAASRSLTASSSAASTASRA